MKSAAKGKRAITNFDNPAQSERFREAARELGPDETGEAFERAFKKVAKGKPEKDKTSPRR